MGNRIQSYGYGTDPAGSKPASRGFAQLIGHLPLVLEHAEAIWGKPEFFFSTDPALAFLSTSYFGGNGAIPLGVLLLLWRRGELIRDCPTCGEKIYVLGCGGSPLSGRYSWWGVCLACRVIQSHPGLDGQGGFAKLYRPIGERLACYQNPPIKLQGGRRARFSWAKGVVGEDDPIVVRPPIAEASLSDIIRHLEGFSRDGQKREEEGPGSREE